MTEKYFSVSFGRCESFFIAYHVDLSLIGQQTLVSRILVLSLFFPLFISRIKFQPPRFHQYFFSGYFRWAQHGRGYTVGMSCGSKPLHPVSKKTRRLGQGSACMAENSQGLQGVTAERECIRVEGMSSCQWSLNVRV